jgi:hypothetical protein
MELLEILKSRAFMQWVAESLAVMFLVGGFVVLAVGLGLYFKSEGTLRFFDTLNRWVSMRRQSRPLEVARDTRPFVQRYRRWLAAIFIAGGAFALYGLTARYDPAAAIRLFRLEIFRPSFAMWVVDSGRWILIVGNFAAVVIGAALAFFPGSVDALEAGGSRWFSERQQFKGADDLRLPLDQKVAAHPRASGLIMAFFGLVLVGAFSLMVFGR